MYIKINFANYVVAGRIIGYPEKHGPNSHDQSAETIRYISKPSHMYHLR